MTCGSSNCACCKQSGCEAFSGTPFSDCHFDVLSGAATGDSLSADSLVLIRYSWSGVDSYCEADPTQLIQSTFTAPGYGDQVRLHVDFAADGTSHYAELTINADDATNGTLKLYKNGAEIATASVNAPPGTYTMKVCFDQATLMVRVTGLTSLEEDSEGNGGVLTAVGTGTVASAVEFQTVEVSHHLYDQNCEDCNELNTCDGCDQNTAPRYLLVELSGFVDINTQPTANYSAWNGSYLVELTNLSPDTNADCTEVGVFTHCHWLNFEDCLFATFPFRPTAIAITVRKYTVTGNYYIVAGLTHEAQSEVIGAGCITVRSFQFSKPTLGALSSLDCQTLDHTLTFCYGDAGQESAIVRVRSI